MKSWAVSSKDLSDTIVHNQETAQTSSSDVEAVDARVWVCWTLDLAWFLTILSPNIAHIVLWVAIFEMAAIMWIYGVGRFSSDLPSLLSEILTPPS